MKECNFNKIKEQLSIEIDDNTLLSILFDINRHFDKQLTVILNQIQKQSNRVFNSIERKLLRTHYYYNINNLLEKVQLDSFPTIHYNSKDIKTVTENTLNRLSNYDANKILNSIKEKYKNLTIHKNSSISHMTQWLKYYNKKRKSKFKYSTFVLRISNNDFLKNNYSEQKFYDLINDTYNNLENYRHLILLLDGQIYDKDNNDITWKLAYKLTIFAENFVQYKEIYSPCKKDLQIKTLQDFIDSRVENATGLAKNFYNNISTGYKYEDCYISNNQEKIIITLKKIALDETPIPCPSCLTTIQSRNSYPKMFLRSFECKNPSCQDRSKSGRGKRFDEYSVYRNFKLEENNPLNIINNNLYKEWRRDIFDYNSNVYEMLLKFYTWDSESVLTYNIKNLSNTFSRNIVDYNELSKELMHDNDRIRKYDDLPIVILYKKINDLICLQTGNKMLKNKIEILQGDSTQILQQIQPFQIGTVITSPPYYNAREYSQWENMLLYFIDVLINTKAILNSLYDNGKYLYNIADIVCEDNVYVKSHMSKRRLPLGFLSCMIFEIVGFNLIENIIWDKGEVHSKRNTTINLASGYVKSINCYEHIFVFAKNKEGKNTRTLAHISPVIKINSKGKNIYKHTAPYPLELVNLVRPYLNKELYVLDPYVGSGTTLKWCKQNNIKGFGIELNNDYYELCKNYIFK